MGNRIEQLRKIISSREVDFIICNDGDDLKIPCNAKNGQWNCIVSAPDEADTLRVYSIIPVVVPQPRRLAVAEFITHANWDLVGCRFELSFENGKLCCECDRYVGEGDVEESAVVWMIDTTFYATDLYLPGLLRVIGSEVSPAKAVLDIEEGKKARAFASLN